MPKRMSLVSICRSGSVRASLSETVTSCTFTRSSPSRASRGGPVALLSFRSDWACPRILVAYASRVITLRGPPLVLLALVTAIAPAALHMLVPALPVLAWVFDAPPGAVQLVLTLFLAAIAVGQLVYGPVSDCFGRRPVLLAGLVLFLAGTLLCGFAWSLAALLVGRTLAALGGCAGMVLGWAIVRDVYDRERSAKALATI
jgi:hypothetical protein